MATVARVTEISVVSEVSFEDAIRAGIERARETLRGMKSAWIKEQEVLIDPDSSRVAGYKVNMLVTFTLDRLIDTHREPYPDVATQLVEFDTMDRRPGTD